MDKNKVVGEKKIFKGFGMHSAPLHSETKIELLGSKDPPTQATY